MQQCPKCLMLLNSLTEASHANGCPYSAPVAETQESVWNQPVDLDVWPLPDVLTKLADWCEHLMRAHNCDEHGYEECSFLIPAARQHAACTQPVPVETVQGQPKLPKWLCRTCGAAIMVPSYCQKCWGLSRPPLMSSRYRQRKVKKVKAEQTSRCKRSRKAEAGRGVE